MRSRRRAGFRWTSTRSGSTCCRSRRTSSTGPKASACSTCGAARRCEPLIVGGGQEHGLRAGTENVAGIAGLAVALTLAETERDVTAPRVAALRDRLEAGIVAAIPDVVVNGAGAPRLPTNLSVAFGDVPSDALLMRLDLDGIAASAGSACAAGSLEPSHVAAAIGLGDRHRPGVIRFSLGRDTTAADVGRCRATLACYHSEHAYAARRVGHLDFGNVTVRGSSEHAEDRF